MTHDVRRLALALGAIGFAVLLMCMQLSFQQAMFNSNLALIRHLRADLIISSAASYTIELREPFGRRRLYQASACPGVESAWPVYIEMMATTLKNSVTGESPSIRVIGFDPAAPVTDIPEVAEHRVELQGRDTALFDVKSKPIFGPVEAGSRIEVAGYRLQVVDTFTLGTDFANDGNLVVSSLTFRKLLGRNLPGDVLRGADFGVVRVSPGWDARQVQRELIGRLPSDVTVRTMAEFSEMELDFWRNATPIGYVFWLGAMMGFVVGVVICYQILYADIADHLAEFATLKAMGYPSRYFIGVVLQEAVLLSVLGFVPGILVSELLCGMIAEQTGLPLTVHASTALIVLALSIGMCVLSGTLTMRKVLAADPAELFK